MKHDVNQQTPGQPTGYQIRVLGGLDDSWSEWFDGLTINHHADDETRPITTISGSLDQSGLRGLLNRLWDMNLTLISVTRAAKAQHTRRTDQWLA